VNVRNVFVGSSVEHANFVVGVDDDEIQETPMG
jgi:hypothetical protein